MLGGNACIDQERYLHFAVIRKLQVKLVAVLAGDCKSPLRTPTEVFLCLEAQSLFSTMKSGKHFLWFNRRGVPLVARRSPVRVGHTIISILIRFNGHCR